MESHYGDSYIEGDEEKQNPDKIALITSPVNQL